jgi:hypothetical protein
MSRMTKIYSTSHFSSPRLSEYLLFRGYEIKSLGFKIMDINK